MLVMREEKVSFILLYRGLFCKEFDIGLSGGVSDGDNRRQTHGGGIIG